MKYEFKKVLFNSLTGRLGNFIYYVWKKQVYCIRLPYRDTKVHPKQETVREAFLEADDAFKTLSPEQRHAWRLAATRKKKFTNYAYFMQVNIKLALQGKKLRLEA